MEKQAKNMNRQFAKREAQTTNKHMRYLDLLVIGEMQIKMVL